MQASSHYNVFPSVWKGNIYSTYKINRPLKCSVSLLTLYFWNCRKTKLPNLGRKMYCVPNKTRLVIHWFAGWTVLFFFFFSFAPYILTRRKRYIALFKRKTDRDVPSIILGTSLLKVKARCLRQKVRMYIKCQIEVRRCKKVKGI